MNDVEQASGVYERTKRAGDEDGERTECVIK